MTAHHLADVKLLGVLVLVGLLALAFLHWAFSPAGTSRSSGWPRSG